MDAILQFLRPLVDTPWSAGLEIGLFAACIYYTHHYFRRTRSARIFTGLTWFLVGLVVLSQALDLVVIRWLLGRYAGWLLLVLVVMFQPELRRLFADLGRASFLSGRQQGARNLDLLCDAVFELASRRCGALIAIERGIGLRTYAESGVTINGEFSSELLLTIFFPKTALHDGGVILRDERIVAAACIFPVTQRESLDRSFGLRHRAGLGLSEETDAVAIVVSEETGSVSLCVGHTIERGVSRTELRQRLGRILLRIGEGPRGLTPGRLEAAREEPEEESV